MSNPILVEQGGFSIPYILSFNYIIEDRRPDLDELWAIYSICKDLKS